MSAFVAVPMTLQEANDFVLSFHRHNNPVVGYRFAIGASDGNELVGVAIIGRPVTRGVTFNDGFTAEVNRCCVREGFPNACSFLYAASWRAWRAMGGRRLITYNLASESGASLRGAGFKVVAELPSSDGRANWTTRPGRKWQAVHGQMRLRWEREA